jgi:hypothetical protein
MELPPTDAPATLDVMIMDPPWGQNSIYKRWIKLPSGFALKMGSAARRSAICPLTLTAQHFFPSDEHRKRRAHLVPVILGEGVEVTEAREFGPALRPA